MACKTEFSKWLKRVNDYCASEYNLSTEDLPDFNWQSLFNDGMNPEEAFIEFCDTVMTEYEAV